MDRAWPRWNAFWAFIVEPGYIQIATGRRHAGSPLVGKSVSFGLAESGGADSGEDPKSLPDRIIPAHQIYGHIEIGVAHILP